MASGALHRGRFAAGFAVVILCALGLGSSALWWTLRDRAAGAASACSDAIPTGRTIAVAWRTTELFTADMLLNRSPACGYDLSTEHLRGGRSREDWAHGRSPVHGLPTHYPPVSITVASRDPSAHQAVYILSRRVAAFIVVGPGGRAEIPMMVGLAAPDAGRGAYHVSLIVEKGSWRVDRVERVVIVDSG